MGRKATNLKKRLKISSDQNASLERKLNRCKHEKDCLSRAKDSAYERVPKITSLVTRVNREGFRGGTYGVQVSFCMDAIRAAVWNSSEPGPTDLSMHVLLLTEQMTRQIYHAVMEELKDELFSCRYGLR